MLDQLQKQMKKAVLSEDNGRFLETVSTPVGSACNAGERLLVYRGNLYQSLRGVLAAAFPRVEKLLGDTAFRKLANDFIRENPPRIPHLASYGEGFDRFLKQSDDPSISSAPWLAELASLEWAKIESLFEADARPLRPEALSGLDGERLMTLRLTPHPTVRLIDCRWSFDADPTMAAVSAQQTGAYFMILRPYWQVMEARIDAGTSAFLKACQEGDSLPEAVEAALAADSAFDFQSVLARLLAEGAFSSIYNPDSADPGTESRI